MRGRAHERDLPQLPASIARWVDLRKAVGEAKALGGQFYVVGNRVEITGELPTQLRDQLDADLLYEYLGAAAADAVEVKFLRDDLKTEVVLVEDPLDLAAALNALTDCNPISIDIETAPPEHRPQPIRINKGGSVAEKQPEQKLDGLCPHRAAIQSVQLYGGRHAYVFRGTALQKLINSNWLAQQPLCAHNAGFELAFLQHYADFSSVTPVEDSMLAAGLIFGPGRSLIDTSTNVLGLKPPKGMSTSAWNAPRLSAGQLSYAASDSVLGWACWVDLEKQLRDTGRMEAYHLMREALPGTAAMHLRGLKLDTEEHLRQTDIWARELAEARHEYCDLSGGEPPPSTAAEIRIWLERVARPHLLKWPRTLKDGLLSTRSGHLKRLILLNEPTVKPLLRILAKEKLLSTFGPSLPKHISPSTGRIHANYLIGAAKTGRYTCSNPNLQQIPQARAPEFKGCFVAADGCLFVGGDYSQVELRVAAWLYGDPVLTAVFADGRDLHAETGALIAGVPASEVTPEDRKAAKPINFGAVFGAGPRTLAEHAFSHYDIDMTLQDAAKWRDLFFSTYSTLRDGLSEHERVCRRRGYMEIPSGRIWLAEWEVETNGHLTYPLTCNWPIQATAAEVLLRAVPLVILYLAAGGIDGGIVAIVHDEILLEVAENQAAAAATAEILKTAMLEAFTKALPGAPTRGAVDVKIGKSWKDLK